MYLLTYVVLVIAILGLFTQVIALQTAQLFKQQTSVARIMFEWHSVAAGVALYKIPRANYPAAGYACNLSPVSTTGVPNCSSKMSVTSFTGGHGYTASYQWHSILYTESNTTPYVITFVLPPAVLPPATTNQKALITSPPLGITMAELSAQLKRTKLTKVAYGIVDTSQRVRSDLGQSTVSGIVYGTFPFCSVPNSVTPGSIVIVSPL